MKKVNILLSSQNVKLLLSSFPALNRNITIDYTVKKNPK